MRSNIMIALGDLALRWPSQLEPWTEHMYHVLKDPSTTVRRHAVLVLSHLILNDMMKVQRQRHGTDRVQAHGVLLDACSTLSTARVWSRGLCSSGFEVSVCGLRGASWVLQVKGFISELAVCLEDQDKRIADLTGLFFFELSRKGEPSASSQKPHHASEIDTDSALVA